MCIYSYQFDLLFIVMFIIHKTCFPKRVSRNNGGNSLCEYPKNDILFRFYIHISFCYSVLFSYNNDEVHRVYCEIRVCHFRQHFKNIQNHHSKTCFEIKIHRNDVFRSRSASYDNLHNSIMYYTKRTYIVMSRRIVSVVYYPLFYKVFIFCIYIYKHVFFYF